MSSRKRTPSRRQFPRSSHAGGKYIQNFNSLNATSLTVGTYTDINALDFTSPQNGSPATALDGNAAANRSFLSATVTGISWSPGASLWLRWTDLNNAESDNGLAIDDLTFTTAPEPSTLALAGIAAMCVVFSVRRRGTVRVLVVA